MALSSNITLNGIKKALSISLFFLPLINFGQIDSTKILPPTGTHTIGITSYQFTDYSRSLSFEPNQGRPRTVGVLLWYPGSNAEYLKSNYTHKCGKSQEISTNSSLRCPFSSQIEKAPLIILFPGRGMPGYSYTHIAEELASHGYAVLSIDMPEIGNFTYPDGYHIKPSNAYSPGTLMRGPYIKVDEFFETPVSIGLEDVRFILEELKSIAIKNNVMDPITNIDFESIGVLGHSLGGRIGGAFADSNKAVKAYMSMEGIPPRSIRFSGMNIPQAHLVSSGTFPYAKNNYQSIIDHQINSVYMILLDKMGHNSITDHPLVSPSDFKYQISPEKGIKIIRELVKCFFQSYLRNTKDFQRVKIDGVKISHYKN